MFSSTFNFMFYFSAGAVLPFWLVMICFPRAKFTLRMVHSPWIILPPVICYLYFLFPNLITAFAGFDGVTPESMAKLMAEPWAASMFWAYAGAFDLFIGRWIFFDAREHQFSAWFISPILFLCIFFGPLGFALYSILKLIRGETSDIISRPAETANL